MTEAGVARAAELIDARDTIKVFLSARDPESELVRNHLQSPYAHCKRDGQRLPTAGVVEIGILDGEVADKDADTLWYCKMPRDVLERALKAELTVIESELAGLGVVPT